MIKVRRREMISLEMYFGLFQEFILFINNKNLNMNFDKEILFFNNLFPILDNKFEFQKEK